MLPLAIGTSFFLSSFLAGIPVEARWLTRFAAAIWFGIALAK